MPNDEEDAFFLEGLRHYGTAVRAAEDFKVVLTTRLIDFVAQYDWKQFKLASDWRSACKRWDKASDLYVSVGLPGQFAGSECTLEIGVQWATRAEGDLDVYAGVHGDVPWKKGLQPLNKVTSTFVGQTCYLTRPLTADATWHIRLMELTGELEQSALIASARSL